MSHFVLFSYIIGDFNTNKKLVRGMVEIQKSAPELSEWKYTNASEYADNWRRGDVLVRVVRATEDIWQAVVYTDYHGGDMHQAEPDYGLNENSKKDAFQVLLHEVSQLNSEYF